MNLSTRKILKTEAFKTTKNILLIIAGCFFLAFGDAIFLTPWNIVAGGVVSIGIIANYLLEPIFHFSVADIAVAIVQALLWLVGLLLLGKKFSFKTALAMVFYPLFFAFFYRLEIGRLLGLGQIYPEIKDGNIVANVPHMMICGTLGGILAGVGVSLAYLGHGSTGGLGILSAVLAKYTTLKEDVSSLLFDGTIIILAAIWRMNEPGIIANVLIGILSAIACSLAIQYIYINADIYVIVDVISSQNDKIADFVIGELDHSVTYINAIGGYSGEKKKMMRIIIYKNEVHDLTSKIGELDSDAFVSLIKANMIHGEGFMPLQKPSIFSKKSKNRPQKTDENSNQ